MAILDSLTDLIPSLTPEDGFSIGNGAMMSLLRERIDIGIHGLTARLRVDGFGSLSREMSASSIEESA